MGIDIPDNLVASYYIQITINRIYSLQDIITTTIQFPNTTTLEMDCTYISTEFITPDQHERRHFLHCNTIQTQYYKVKYS